MFYALQMVSVVIIINGNKEGIFGGKWKGFTVNSATNGKTFAIKNL